MRWLDEPRRPTLTALHLGDPAGAVGGARVRGRRRHDRRSAACGSSLGAARAGHQRAGRSPGSSRSPSIDGLPTTVAAGPQPAPTTPPQRRDSSSTTSSSRRPTSTGPPRRWRCTGCRCAGFARSGTSPPSGFRQGFRRLGPGILELVEAKQLPPARPRFWGLVVIVRDLGRARQPSRERPRARVKPAVQPGRQIVTLKRAAGSCRRVRRRRPSRSWTTRARTALDRRYAGTHGAALTQLQPHHARVVRRRVRRADARPGAGVAGDRLRRARPDLAPRPGRARRSPRSCTGSTGSRPSPRARSRGIRLVYVSPLKALSYDIDRNLRVPLRGIGAEIYGRRPHRRHAAEGAPGDAARAAGHPDHDARVAVPDADRPGPGAVRRDAVVHRRRDPRRRLDEARRAPRADARAPQRRPPGATSSGSACARPRTRSRRSAGSWSARRRTCRIVDTGRAQAARPPDPRPGRVDGRA